MKHDYKIERLGGLMPEPAFNAVCALPLPFIFPARESTTGGPYTYISAAPSITINTNLDGATTVTEDGKIKKARDPFYAISEIINEQPDTKPGPFPFSGGAAGYFAYDLKNILDGPNRGTAALKKREPGLCLPLCKVGIYNTVYVYDHNKKEACLITRTNRKNSNPETTVFINSLQAAAEVFTVTGGTPAPVTVPRKSRVNRSAPELLEVESNTTRAEHITAIKTALDYISAGDIYQINLSHMLRLPLSTNSTPFEVFKRLTERSPAPFAAYIDAGDFQILSNSPERLLLVKESTATIEPIKGTRARGETELKDRALITELKESVKERAEHVMIVDLERNDLGRVSVPGGVRVTEFERVVTLPGLHHMVSTVQASIRSGVDSLGVLRAAYPGGSITGAPKVRAMEIIDELEHAPRSLYTGGIGWIDFSGNLDISMAIRTAVAKDNSLYLNVGGGIVADSDPEAEYKETILKAMDFIEVTKEPTG